MEKTIKINIAGVVFEINEDAFESLRRYLQEINNLLKNSPGGTEMIEDIEARIAEIFQSKPSWETGIISIEEVEEMKSTMGSPEQIAGEVDEDGGWSQSRHEHRPYRRLYRDPDNSIIGGVCSGLGAYLRVDPVWIRILFVLFSIVYLSGLFIYVVLWIAIPNASTPSRKRDLYSAPDSSRKDYRAGNNTGTATSGEQPVYSTVGSRKVGNAFNEIFRAFGKFFIILFRIILAIIGVSFIISGFSLILSFIVIGFFNGSLFGNTLLGTDLFHLPDFLGFIVDPSLSPWLLVLTSMVILLPLLGIIYWGIRMVFQFRVRDLTLNLVMVILWVISCTTLSLLLFSQGISFSTSGRTVSDYELPSSDTLYIKMGSAISDIEWNTKFHMPFDDEFSLYLDEEKKVIYGTPQLDIYQADDDDGRLTVKKYSNGRTRADANEKADNIMFGVKQDGNRIFVDEYFTIPAGNRWSGGRSKLNIYLPLNKVIFIDEDIEHLFDSYIGNGVYAYELGDNWWEMTEEGLERLN